MLKTFLDESSTHIRKKYILVVQNSKHMVQLTNNLLNTPRFEAVQTETKGSMLPLFLHRLDGFTTGLFY